MLYACFATPLGLDLFLFSFNSNGQLIISSTSKLLFIHSHSHLLSKMSPNIIFTIKPSLIKSLPRKNRFTWANLVYSEKYKESKSHSELCEYSLIAFQYNTYNLLSLVPNEHIVTEILSSDESLYYWFQYLDILLYLFKSLYNETFLWILIANYNFGEYKNTLQLFGC